MDFSKYRTIDGSCNNLGKPRMGQVFTPLQRILPNAYADGMLWRFWVLLDWPIWIAIHFAELDCDFQSYLKSDFLFGFSNFYSI